MITISGPWHIFDRKLFPRPKQKIHDYIGTMSGPATYRTEVADPAPQHLLLFCMGSPSTPTSCGSIHIYLLEKEEKTGYYRYVLSSNKSLDRRHIPVIVFFWVIMILTLPLVECVTRSNFSCFLYMYICKYHIYENKWLTKKLIGPRYPIQNSRWDKIKKNPDPTGYAILLAGSHLR